MNINKILNSPIKILPKKHSLLTAFLVTMFVYLFFLFFTPFDSYDFVYNNHSKFITIPIIVFIVVLFFLQIFYKYDLFYFDKNNWTLKKQIIYIFLMLNCISLFIFLNDYFFVHYFFVKFIFLKLFIYTFAVGIIPIALSSLWIKIFFENDSNISNHKIDIKDIKKFIYLSSEDKKTPDLKILSTNFLFIKSENNYCKIVYLKNNQLTFKLLRLTLKNAEKQLESFNELLRCHRSYTINKTKIIKIVGNSKSSFIYLTDYNFGIPVSRSNFKSIKESIR